ncbi:unnamed protein product [Nezara viridula]|uniref:alanine transaminase n=1 Tax=Nezara viridula TaxID=85310 RepID=A0A9P0HBC8_NEZVI|nr:unnamed protein product [Nezara viridula]
MLEATSGDMQSSGYKPLTFLRQVASASLYPPLLEDECFPDDVKCKVKEILKHYRSVGGCTESVGVKMFRMKLANYLRKRDCGVSRDHDDLMLNGGVTEGIRNILTLLYGFVDSKQPAVVIPSPSYPYGIIEELGFKQISYELDEENCWASTTENMECAIADAKEKYALRAMVIINPSNPTSTVLRLNELEEIVKFTCKEKMILIVDEIMMYAFADHPTEGDPSYEQWKKETESRFKSFACKAKVIVDELNKIEGFSCPPMEGGLFAYTKIYVPEKAIKEGKRKCYNPSTFYAIQLLEETGILVTPGDVFGKEHNPHISKNHTMKSKPTQLSNYKTLHLQWHSDP